MPFLHKRRKNKDVQVTEKRVLHTISQSATNTNINDFRDLKQKSDLKSVYCHGSHHIMFKASSNGGLKFVLPLYFYLSCSMFSTDTQPSRA